MLLYFGMFPLSYDIWTCLIKHVFSFVGSVLDEIVGKREYPQKIFLNVMDFKDFNIQNHCQKKESCQSCRTGVAVV